MILKNFYPSLYDLLISQSRKHVGGVKGKGVWRVIWVRERIRGKRKC